MLKYLFTITALFIFVYATADAAVDIYLTNQDNVRTTQFGRGDSVYIEGSCPVAASSEDGIRFYIAYDKNWVDGDKLTDVSASIESLKVSSDAIPRTLIWRSPLNDGAYDVIIDVNNDYILQAYENCILGMTGTGFRVGNPPPAPTPAPSPTPPPPAPAPTPTPAPSILEQPQNFSLQDAVEVKNFANVRKSAGGLQLGQQTKGAQGIIVGGPVKASVSGKEYWFWSVDFTEDPDGWVSDQTLIEASAKPAEQPKDEPAKVETISEPATTTVQAAAEVPVQAPEPAEKELAQVSDASSTSGMNQLINALVIGMAILLGLVVGSSIIARAMRKG